MNCPKCNKEVPGGKKFCSGCGAPISAPSPAPASKPTNPSTGKTRLPPGTQPAGGKGKKRGKKPLTSKEIKGFDPPKLKPDLKKKAPETESTPKVDIRKIAVDAWAALATPWKFIPPVDSKFSGTVKSGLTLAVASILVAIV
ncbi:MAG: zinc ribbon domain-containing protein, partial [Bacteroidales bacterium]|nr:zinc ribbon domain-containing protein [Candidatus Latescibacterota bacterium]